MVPKIVCRVCSSEVQPADKFCSSCGAKLELQDAPSPPPAVKSGTGAIRCDLCGNSNPAGAVSCESCGNALSAGVPSGQTMPRSGKAAAVDRRASPLKGLQSWKLTVGVGVILVAVLVYTKTSRNVDTPVPNPAAPPVSGAMAQQIEALEKTVDANPEDQQAILHLANALHDARAFPRAITIYKRYLELNPSDADARVDLGISYFELGLSDSTNTAGYLQEARQTMEKALTYAPRHQLAHFNLGIVCLHTGDVVKANEWFRKCAEIDPNSETGKKAQMLISKHTFNQPS